MASFRAALIQLTSSDDPAENLPRIEALLREAAAGGAQIALTPEVSNILSSSRTRQAETLTTEAEDPTLARLREVAAETGLWLSIGSLALLSENAEGRFANRQFLIAPDGAIVARYDKIHMFDVTLGGDESYRESASYRPGDKAVLAETPFG
ncbi:MAG: nitrilase-related carbon-nitrogen hydrolase, partial [Pseudomonadota bacterium]